jgi:uncharacterized membrane protein YcaP (DUF421 family)
MDLDFGKILAPDVSLLEIFIRGTATYLFLYFLLRFAVKRQLGATGVGDLLVVVLIADAVQNAMTADYTGVGAGLFLVVVIVAWAIAIEAAAYKWPAFARIVKPSSLPLVKNGEMLRRNMRRELITEEDLRAQLRHHGVHDLAEVRQARMEGDGQLSVVLENGDSPDGPKQQRGVV